VHYCGIVPANGSLQLAMLEEVRTTKPPIRLGAMFFEPGSAAQVDAELRSLGDVVVAVGAFLPRGHLERPARTCDGLLRRRGVGPQAADPEAGRLGAALADLGLFTPGDDGVEGTVPEGAYAEAPVVETSPDGVFCVLRGRRLPAKRHPVGMDLRIELLQHHVLDEGGDLWHRRSEEIDAAATALCAHRYAVGHACWLGAPAEGVVVLPGSSLPEKFTTEGVLPPVERLQLPPLG
jgi:uncharacterized protein DUF429